MDMLRILWKLLPKEKRQMLFARHSVIDRQYFNDVLDNKKLPRCFHETRSIYVHVPKCAGTSIARSLYGDKAGGHRPAEFYQHRFPKEYNDYFTFAFVRNPWDRVVSAWIYLRQNQQVKKDIEWHKVINQFDSFESFIALWLNEDNILKKIHFVPQYRFFNDSNGIMSLDYIGRMETIAKDFVVVSKKLNISNSLVDINKSRSQDYRVYYSDSSAEQVARVYARDIDLLGYHFDGYYEDHRYNYKVYPL